ncbi:MAG: transcriptional regulator [Candidatus Aenigmatarchaeota archaeon]
MKCEIFSKEYLPAIRALIAKELTSRGFTQKEAADRLYLTQPAIAFYKKQSRGKKSSELMRRPEIKSLVEELAKGLSTKQLPREALEKEYCRFCALIFGE